MPHEDSPAKRGWYLQRSSDEHDVIDLTIRIAKPPRHDQSATTVANHVDRAGGAPVGSDERAIAAR